GGRSHGTARRVVATTAIEEENMATETKLEGLEQELSTLLDVETFDPPEDFRSAALISDGSAHEEAARDPQAWWAKLPRGLAWFTAPEQLLEDSNPPLF